MSIEKHDLVHEFPDHHHTIRHLKMHDKHFHNLFEKYNTLDYQVRKAEEGSNTLSDNELTTLKSERVTLKDTLFGLIKKAEATL